MKKLVLAVVAAPLVLLASSVSPAAAQPTAATTCGALAPYAYSPLTRITTIGRTAADVAREPVATDTLDEVLLVQ